MRLPSPPSFRPVVAARLVRLALILGFVWLVGRHWHPHYGFTRFLQCDPDVSAKGLSAFRDAPVYVHPDPGSYDGFFYAEIATDPSLRDPALASAVDDLGYRARRILLSAAAWILGGGEPIAVAHAYAWLNLLAWLALAALLWRLFPCSDWRGTVAWAGVLFATGTLLSVRFALTDLPALLFTAAALLALENKNRRPLAAACLALAGLARETALLALPALWPREKSFRPLRVIASVLLAVLPLLLWLAYVRATVGASGQGLGNFAWPLTGLIGKIRAVAAEPFAAHPWVVGTSTLAYLALLVQLLFVLRHPAPRDSWWRLGVAFGALLLCLGPAVWGDDLPGAAVRVLLPLTLAFNVLAVRRRAAVTWLVLGNLSVLGGASPLWSVARDAHEFAADRFPGGTYVVHTDAGFYATEIGRKSSWAWSRGTGGVRIEWWPRRPTPPRLALALRGFAPCDVKILRGDTPLWRGRLTTETRWVDLEAMALSAGCLDLRLQTDTPPGHEAATAGARALAFALSGVRVE